VSVNNHKPHVIVLPEDDANRQIANGFLLDPSIKLRNIQVLNPAGGWGKVLDRFLDDHVAELRKWPQRHLVLLIDFDGLLTHAPNSSPANSLRMFETAYFCWAHRANQSLCANNTAIRSKASARRWQQSATETKPSCGTTRCWRTTRLSACA